jgi:GTPase SAR1 family protein
LDAAVNGIEMTNIAIVGLGSAGKSTLRIYQFTNMQNSV